MSGLAKMKIEGKIYEHYQSFKKKPDADKFASKMKSQGASSARVVPRQGVNDDGSGKNITWYGVWVR
jgi:hypothetical protein